MKTTVKIFITGIIMSFILSFACNAQTNITDSMRCNIYLSEKNEDTYASSFVMLINRILVLKGENPPFDTSIADMQKTAYGNTGIKDSFTYKGTKIKKHSIKPSTTVVKDLLKQHPEGVVIGNSKNCVLVISYDDESEEFMCLDANPLSPLGEIPLAKSSIKSAEKASAIFTYSHTDLKGDVIFKTPLNGDTANIIYHDGATAIYDVQTESVAKYFYLTDAIPQKSGMRFIGWSDNATANTVSYVPGGIYTLYGDINLYAVYEKEETHHRKQTYTVNYFSNEELVHTQTVDGTGFTTFTPNMPLPKKEGYKFMGWRASFYGENLLYPVCEPFKLCSDMDFYAVWQKNGTYSITYSAIHATNVPYRQLANSENITISPITPKKDGYVFKGWYTSDGKVLKPLQEIELTNNLMLYALFEKGNPNVLLYAEKESFNSLEPVVLTFDKASVSGAKYTVNITNLTDNTQTQHPCDGRLEVSLPQGQYTAFVRADYTYGSLTSNKVNFFVWGEKTNSKIDVYADGKNIVFDTEPFVQNGVTLVPLRAIISEFGAQLFWNEKTETVTAVCGINVLKFTVNSGVYYKNGEQKTVSEPPQIKDGRVHIPLRAFAEGFDYKVYWQNDTQNIYIYSSNYGSIGENAYYINNGSFDLANNDIWIISRVSEYPELYEIRSFYDGTYLAVANRCVEDNAQVTTLHAGAYLSALWIIEKHDDGYYIKNAENESLYLNNSTGNPVLNTNKHSFKILPLMQF